jgi:hypothetical protein
MFDDVRELNERLTINPPRIWCALSKAREEAVKYGSFCFSDGTVCEKIIGGWEPSGRYTTLDANGKLVVMLRVHCDIEQNRSTGVRDIVSMGDDTVQATPEKGQADELVSSYGAKGVFLTIESEPGFFHQQNFCSKVFGQENGRYVPIPMNWIKNCFALQSVDKSSEPFLGDTLLNLCVEYAFHPDVSQLRDLLAEYYPAHWRSEQWCKHIVAGWESSHSS